MFVLTTLVPDPEMYCNYCQISAILFLNMDIKFL